jgi:hypothetical protein
MKLTAGLASRSETYVRGGLHRRCPGDGLAKLPRHEMYFHQATLFA